MENKKKYSIEIANIPLTIVSNEDPSFVENIASILNKRISEMTQSSRFVSTLDACILCSLDYLSDKIKAEKKLRAYECQLSTYETNIQRLRAELDAANARLAEQSTDTDDDNSVDVAGDVASDMKRISDILCGGQNGSSSADKVRTLEKYLESKQSEGHSDDTSREEKIKYIESLLRGNSSNE